ncbi:hypothetical protein Scani_34550 [Streptomyces caniferus]|uniref:Uncharacterized protein n=1 Tax=Streptomyces caniferus TaxID=285557 RepID=A0A640S815_9ACTN|nr:hypothetical protein Scani_34550 [Streptomyces caniferus]
MVERLRRRGAGLAPMGVSGRSGGAVVGEGIWGVLGWLIAPDFPFVLVRG